MIVMLLLLSGEARRDELFDAIDGNGGLVSAGCSKL